MPVKGGAKGNDLVEACNGTASNNGIVNSIRAITRKHIGNTEIRMTSSGATG